MFWLILLAIVAAFILGAINIVRGNKKYGFKSTVSTLSLAVDAQSKQMRIGYFLPHYFKIADVIDIDMDVRTKKGHTIRNAAIGGLVAGNIGAWVGASSTADKISKIIIRVTLKDGSKFSTYIKDPKKNDLNDLQRIVDIAGDLASTILDVEDISEGTNSLDDIVKLKELVDAGVLTEEEFSAKKKQILGI